MLIAVDLINSVSCKREKSFNFLVTLNNNIFIYLCILLLFNRFFFWHVCCLFFCVLLNLIERSLFQVKKVLLIGLMASAVLTGCVSGQGSSSNGKLERWTTFDGKTTALSELGDKQSRVVFLRESEALAGPAVNVYVDGDYLTSLLGGGYRETVICSAGDVITPTFVRNDGFVNRRDTGVHYSFVTGETSYVKVVADDVGEPVFQRISNEEGQSLMANLKEETQTHPRIKPNKLCEKAVLSRFTLQASSLFKFNKYDYKNMLPKGREEIASLGAKLKERWAKVDSLQVVGYTDPVGSEKYNNRLSKRRAETVKKALLRSGIEVPIKVEGLGEKNLLVRNCGTKFKGNAKARIACDQPNRRVEIILYGEAKQ